MALTEPRAATAIPLNTLWPADSDMGVAIPLAVQSFAFTVTCEMVRAAFPVLVMDTLFEFALPTLIEPKLTLAGLDDRVTDAVTPVPLSATEDGELAALLAMLTV